jgi:Subtilase family
MASPRLTRFISALGLALAAMAATPAQAQQRPASVAQSDGLPEIVVQLRDGVNAANFAAAQGLTVLDQFGSRPIWQLRMTVAGDPVAESARLAALPEVVFAEPNFEGDTPESVRNSVWLIGASHAEYIGQWAPDALRLDQAHAVSTGKGVRIAVLDTGVERSHPALAGKLATRLNGSLLGIDLVDMDNDPSEVGGPGDLGWGHGTHVAGLLALTAPGAKLMPVRVLEPNGSGNIWVLAEGLGWAVDPDGRPTTDDGAHVINLSVGTLQPTKLLQKAVALATCSLDDDDDDFAGPGFEADRQRCLRRFGAVVLASAGNSGSPDELVYPAAEGVKGSRAVAATSPDKTLATFSNFGSWVKLAAPGDRIISSVPGGAWGTWSGTSMAAPIAAGVAALVITTPAPALRRSRFRNWNQEDVLKRIEDRSAPLCGPSLKQIDAAAAVTDTPPPDPACP